MTSHEASLDGRNHTAAPYSGYFQREAPPPERHLTEVGPGTPMGEYFRRFWHPICLTAELDDVPKTVRIMGEDLIVFRDKSGQIGLFHPFCCHRGASLEFGIISQRGLRCAYHGWLFDIDGKVLETPGEPPESRLNENLFQGAYPAQDIRGLVHAYLGPPDLKPHLPHYDIFDIPGAQFAPFSTPFPNNWLQSHENNIDPIHAVFLHQRITEQFVKPFSVLPNLVWELSNNGEGLFYTAERRLDAETVWVRTLHVLVPGGSFVPSTWGLGEAPLYYQRALYMRFTLPVDDEHNIVYGWRVHGDGFPGGYPERNGPGRVDMDGQISRDNQLSFEEIQRSPDDYQMQGTLWGGATLPLHKKEHLGTSDIGVALMRRTFRNILDGSVPEAWPTPASEEPEGPKTRNIYSFDAMVRVREQANWDTDRKMMGRLGKELTEAVIEIAENTSDQTERDRVTRERFKEIEKNYQASY